jgi:hypothetical protein
MKKISFLLFPLLLLCSCADEDTSTYSACQTVIDLQAEVVQEYTTRISDMGFADGDAIGVYIVNYEDGQAQPLRAAGNYVDNVRFTYQLDVNKWVPSYQLYYKDIQTHIDAYGYYPFDANITKVEDYPFTLQRNQRDVVDGKNGMSGYEASDFLWAKAEDVVPSEARIPLKCQHIMAGMEVTLLPGEGFTESKWLGLEKNVLVENTALSTYINLSTGKVDVDSNASAMNIIPQQSGSSWRAIVAPQTVAAGASLLAITVDGQSYHFKRESAMVFLSGKLHKFTIRVDQRLPEGDYEFTLLDESITAWENDPLSHNGTAREYITVQIKEEQSLGDVLKSRGLKPSEIINLKLIGTLSAMDHYSGNFFYIRENMTSLEALNMKELRIKGGMDDYYGRSWKEIAYGKGEGYSDGNDVIPYCGFENMGSLKYVVMPDSLKAIGSMAFAGTGLTGSLILPEGLKYIGGDAFTAYGHKPSNLVGELYIPSTVEYIGDNAFGAYDGRRDFWFSNELILPERMIYLGSGAFLGCKYMTGSVRIPEGLEVVYDSWPWEIGGTAIVPQGVKVVNGLPKGVSYVYLPEGVEELGEMVLIGASKLKTSLRLPSTIKKIGRCAFERSAITHVSLPEGLEIVEDYLCYRCENLQDTITIPSTVKQIRSGAFSECNQLTAVVLPAGLEEIQDGAFANCVSMDYIQCLGSTPPAITDNTFSGVEKNNFTVVVPEGAVEDYRNAEGWREFKRISAYRNFVCRPMQAKLLNKSNVREIVLNADEAWTVKYCPDWVHLDKTSGYKKTELKATIDAMPHGNGDREDNVVFQLNRTDENGEPITCYFKVSQFDYHIEEDGLLIMQKATKGNRGGIDIMFVGDGYDAEDIARERYRQDMEEEMEYFFAVEPYKTYKEYFNVHAAMAMSYESGVVDSPDKWRNTKFSVTYGAGENGRLAVDDGMIGAYVLDDVEKSPVNTTNISRSLIICVPNSDAYEGITFMYGDGSAIAICPHSRLDYPNDARGLIQHEAGGHGWGKLADEYIYHRNFIQTCPCTCCGHVAALQSMQDKGWARNLSLTGKYKDIEWRHLCFDPRYDDIVDIYEGGFMHARGVYRSEVNSCMNNNVPYFSTISRQEIVERIMKAAGEPFDFETFVSKDSREMGEKFLTRSSMWDYVPDHQVRAIHSEHHGPVMRKGSPMDYIKKKK